MWVRSLGREDPLEEGMATHTSIFAWRILWTEEPGGQWFKRVRLNNNIWFNVLSNTLIRHNICACVLSHFSGVWLFATLWTIARQAPPSMGFSRQEYWGGLPFPLPGDFPDPGIEPTSLMSLTLAIRFFTLTPPGKPNITYIHCKNLKNTKEKK